MNRYCLLTNDVEMTSIRFNRLSPEAAELVWREGMRWTFTEDTM